MDELKGDEQQDAKTNDAPGSPDPAEQAPPDPGLAASGAGVTPAIPDAVKMAGVPGVDGLAPSAVTAGEGGSAGNPMGINEPSMDFGLSSEHAADLPEAHPAEFPQLAGSGVVRTTRNIDLLMDVKLPVSIELGRTTLAISEILQWGQGSIVELDKLAGEPVNLMVNNKLVARGEVVVVDEKFGLRITSLISPQERTGHL